MGSMTPYRVSARIEEWQPPSLTARLTRDSFLYGLWYLALSVVKINPPISVALALAAVLCSTMTFTKFHLPEQSLSKVRYVAFMVGDVFTTVLPVAVVVVFPFVEAISILLPLLALCVLMMWVFSPK